MTGKKHKKTRNTKMRENDDVLIAKHKWHDKNEDVSGNDIDERRGMIYRPGTKNGEGGR